MPRLSVILVTGLAIMIISITFIFETKNFKMIKLKNLNAESQQISTSVLIKKQFKSKILFNFFNENSSMYSYIRSVNRKFLIDNEKIDPTTLPNKYGFNAKYMSFENKLITSNCINIYPSTENEQQLVEENKCQVILFKTPYGNTPIALHGANDFHSNMLRSGNFAEADTEKEILTYLNGDSELAFIDFGSMIGLKNIFKHF